MVTQSRPIPHRRAAPRINVDLGCQFIVNETEHKALIKNISTVGALLWSGFMPPPTADVSIKIGTSLLKLPIILQGKIVRRSRVNTERGPIGAFAVKFSRSSPALMALINKLVSL